MTIKAIQIEKTKVERKGRYEYDTAATHHTTNEYDQLTDIQHNLQIKVTAHDKSESICKTMGTLVFRHNGRNIRHEQCLYDPSYSNIVSGLRMPEEFVMTDKKDKVELKVGKRTLYKINCDSEGLWIKPDNKVADWKAAGIKKTEKRGERQGQITSAKGKEAAQELHERYGHISYNTLRTLPEYPKDQKEKIQCKAYEQGKATKPPSPKQPQEPRTNRLLERIYVDLIGPIKPTTPGRQY